jgi:urease accessory protein
MIETNPKDMESMERLAGLGRLDLGRFIGLSYLSSPARPLGAFSFSGGLSSYIEKGLVKDGDSLLSYLLDLISLSLIRNDLPILLRSFEASLKKDMENLFFWSDLSLASRETSELSLEEKEMGRAVVRLMESAGLLAEFPGIDKGGSVGYVAAYGLFGASLGILPEDAPYLLASYLWAYVENLATAASKSVPLGQNEVQKVLIALTRELPSFVSEALKVRDEDIGGSLPMLAIMSSWHEESPIRMYRS